MIEGCDGNHDIMFLLSTGNLRMDGEAARVVRGSIKCFVDSHGDRITPSNVEGLVKRIVSGMGTALRNKEEKRRPYKQFGGPFLDEHIENYSSIRQVR